MVPQWPGGNKEASRGRRLTELRRPITAWDGSGGREYRVPTRGIEQGAASRRDFLRALAMPVALAASAAPLAPREETAGPGAPPPPVDSSLRAVRQFLLPVGALPAIVFRAVPPEDS